MILPISKIKEYLFFCSFFIILKLIFCFYHFSFLFFSWFVNPESEEVLIVVLKSWIQKCINCIESVSIHLTFPFFLPHTSTRLIKWNWFSIHPFFQSTTVHTATSDITHSNTITIHNNFFDSIIGEQDDGASSSFSTLEPLNQPESKQFWTELQENASNNDI